MVLFHCCQFVRISPLQSGGKAGDAPDQSQIQNDQGDRPEHIPIGKGDEIPKQLEQGISLGGEGEHIIQLRNLTLPIQDLIIFRIAVEPSVGEVDQGVDAHSDGHGDGGRAEIEADLSRGEEEHGHGHAEE